MGTQIERQMNMELFLDTADAREVARLDEVLTIEGVTTNPTIITSSGKTPEQVAAEMCAVLAPEQKLFMQAVDLSSVDACLEDARRIQDVRPENMYVKIPVTEVGLAAIKRAKREGMNVLATAIYSADQAFLAAMNGADYLAPYVNRMCAYGDGVAQVVELLGMLDKAGLDSKVIAASFKNAYQVHQLISAGIQAVTAPASVVRDLYAHPATEPAVDVFTDAWRDAFGRTTFA